MTEVQRGDEKVLGHTTGVELGVAILTTERDQNHHPLPEWCKMINTDLGSLGYILVCNRWTLKVPGGHLYHLLHYTYSILGVVG